MKAAQLEITIDKVIEKNPSIQVLKSEQHRQGEEQHRQGVILEYMQSQIQTIIEVVTPLLKNSEAASKVNNTLSIHSQEIAMTQQALKHHIKDPNAHSVIRKS